VVVLEPVQDEGQTWYLGYTACGEGWEKTEWCDVMLQGLTAALIGPDDVSFFGLDHELRQIQIRIVCRVTKEKLSSSIRLV
jgi:hypothetical protein